jgi:orotidine-5'-phosphate decarboxylase
LIDRLISRIDELQAPIVVGLDPAPEMIPQRIRDMHGGNIPGMFLDFNRVIIDAVCDLVPAVKPQIAMYERFGSEGISAYEKTCEHAQSKGLIVIGDVKRGDIASTAEAYAAHLKTWPQDAVTLSPYLGGDTLAPFIKVCAELDKAIFVLVKTSNPGSGDLQDLRLESGELVYERVAGLVSDLGKSLIGVSGYSKVGAVVGATWPEQGVSLRKKMPHTFFLVPGYGAQGGKGADLRGFFDKNGRGCVVNSSRGIIAAWQKDKRYGEGNVGEAAREAVLAMRADLREALS